jgi:hypothetical protein
MGWFRNLGSDRPWAQGCVIAGAGAALAATSCFGFLITLDFNGSNTSLGEAFSMGIAVVFGISALAIPVGLVWFIVGLVKNAAKGKAAPPAQPAPPPPPAQGPDSGAGPVG